MKKLLLLLSLLACQSGFAGFPPITSTGENYINILPGQKINANAVNLAGSNVTGVLPLTSATHPQIYYHYPVVAGVAENDVVMNAIDPNNGQAPLSFKKAVNNDVFYYPQLYGVAKNVSGGFADIYLGQGTVVPGFSFGAFIGVEYYIDPATPGGLTFTAPATGANPIKIGRALDATHLILDPKGNFVQGKGDIYTSDGVYDGTLVHGSNGAVPFYNSAATYGMGTGAAVVAAAPFTYMLATRTLTAATATNSVAGFMSASDHALLHNALTIGTANGLSLSTQALSLAVATDSVPGAMSAADHTTFSGLAPKASPTFTGTVTLPAINLINAASSATNAVLVYKNGHLKSTQTTVPTATVNANAGTGATCTLSNATDSAGTINLTTGTLATASGEQCKVNFNAAYNVAPICVVSSSSATAGADAVVRAVYFTTTTAKLSVNFNVAEVSGTSYNWSYYCIETQ